MISIIIIVKNDRGIENTLDYLQKVKKPEKTEIIVVDASEGSLDDMKDKFPKVRWIYFHNKTDKKITIPEQRNLGIKKSKGDIIVFIDANCIPKDDWLIKLINPIRKDREDIVSGVVKSVNKSIYDSSFGKTEKSRYIDECPTGNLSFRKDIIKKIGFFDESFEAGEDIDFSWRAINKGYKIRFNKDSIVYHDWGNIEKLMNRGYRYGKARVILYKKNPSQLKRLFNYKQDLFTIYAPLFSIYIISIIPVTFFWHYYPLFILIPLIKNIRNYPIRKMLSDFFWGLGVFKELIFPSKFIHDTQK